VIVFPDSWGPDFWQSDLMRILFGCNSQGQGHLSTAATLVPLLEERGHEVRVVTSGFRPAEIYHFRWHCHLPGLPYVLVRGKTDFRQTAINWFSTLPKTCWAIRQVQRVVDEFEPELILSDFEPLTGSPFLKKKCEVISLCRQTALLDPDVPLPAGDHFAKRITGTMVRIYTMGTTQQFGYHYAPCSSRCLPPVIRKELYDLPNVEGKHLFVYNYYHTGRRQLEDLMEWSQRRGVPVRAYGFQAEIPRGQHGLVLMQPDDRYQMLLDMSTCRAAIVTAGLMTPLEAFLLRKPVMAVPLEEQWEQYTNAWQLDQAGMARMSQVWDFDGVMEIPAPSAQHPLWKWLTTPAQRILDAVLRENFTDSGRSGQQFAA